jgi:hypothetical protein
MSEWKEKLKKRQQEEAKKEKPKGITNLDNFTKSQETLREPEIESPPEIVPISPRELHIHFQLGTLTEWEHLIKAPYLTSDRLRISHELLFGRMCRMRKDEILEDLLRVCLSNLPAGTAIKYVKSFQQLYDTLEDKLNLPS